MKIALLSYEYPPETGYGGIGTYTWYQARALVKLGHEVHVLAGAKKDTNLRETEHDGVRVFRFRSQSIVMRGFKHLEKYRLWWTKNRLENAVSMYQAFRQLNREHQYDIVEMPECGAEGFLINHLMDLQVVIKLHSPSRLIMPFYDVRRADTRFCSFFEQKGITGAKAFASCSNFLANEAHEKLKITETIRVIPNGIDLDLFELEERTDILRKYEVPNHRPVLLFSGRMENRKGIHLCKEIVASILERHEVSFVFAGQDLFGYMEGVLMPYWNSKNFRGSMHYLGRLPHNEVRSLLRQTDLFLFPSLWENCPYSCLEAMAAGCGIVSTDQGGMPELLNHGSTALLARNGDPGSYISSLDRLIEDPAFRRRLGNEARKRIEAEYTDIEIAKKSVKFYGDCLEVRN